jgi:hypothetical protein
LIPRWIAFYRGPNQRRAGSAFDRELQGSGSADVLWIFVQRWQESGYIPPQWRHGEPGTSFAALGPPRSTVRLYYAEHLARRSYCTWRLASTEAESCRNRTKQLVEQRLAQWRRWFPNGARLDDQNRLVARR